MRSAFSCLALLAMVAITSACTESSVEPRLSPSSGGGEATSGSAHGEAEGAEKKKKQAEDKPKPDSIISSVLALPEVKKWADWMEAKDNGSRIVAWGEFVRTVNGSQCWSIAVGEENAKGSTTVWKRFCPQQKGLEMWVESPLGAKSIDDPNFITYDTWRKQCAPSYNSPGNC